MVKIPCDDVPFGGAHLFHFLDQLSSFIKVYNQYFGLNMAILHFPFRQTKVADKTIAHEQLKKHVHRMTFAHSRTRSRVRNKYKYFPRNTNNKML